MAILPVKFPANFPDLMVTSYIRKDSPSHSQGNTIDIVPIWPIGISKSVMFFQYFYIWKWLATSQTRGVTRFAIPSCLHFHIQDDPSVNFIGYEFVKKTPQGCQVQVSSDGRPFIFQEDKRNYSKAMSFKIDTESKIIDKFINGAQQAYYGALALTTPNRFLTVYPNNQISENKLQSILSMYTGNTAAAVISNEAANAWGFNTPKEIQKAAQDELLNIAIWAGVLGLGGFLLYKFLDKKADRLFDDRPVIQGQRQIAQ